MDLRLKSRPKGESCLCCGELDSSPDPIQPQFHRLWGWHTEMSKAEMARLLIDILTLITHGGYCWYCVRTWNSKYNARLKTLEHFKLWVFASEQNHEEFSLYQAWLIQQILKKFEQTGVRARMRLVWPEPWKLRQEVIYRVRWVQPEKEYLELKDYTPTWGDPRTNGRGDKIEIGPGNVELVLTSTSQKWKKMTEVISDTKKTRNYGGDENDAVDQGHVDNKAADLFAAASAPVAPKAKGKAAPPKAIPKEEAAYAKLMGEDLEEPDLPASSTTLPAKGQSLSAALSAASPAKKQQAEEAAGGSADHGAASPSGQAQPAGKAKSRAKAKAQGKGGQKRPNEGGGCESGPNKKGRKTRDANLLLRAGLREFKESDFSFEKYFTPLWSSQTSRNWNNYISDMDALIEGTDDKTTLHELEVTRKQAVAVRAVLGKMRSSGMESLVAARTYQDKVGQTKTITLRM